ncbi:MAG: hypothetical protein J1F12_03655 [Muribaculaceae bacterium]|nr:hypothetical protein [Muribaculaceae bacterium]
MKKFPPIEKIFEAWTALADNRVLMKEGYADVSSSDGEKSYVVRFLDNQYSSDDNATFWQGYPGYPVIAVLMKQGKLSYDPTQANQWKNINWTQINKKFKNNYAEAVAYVAGERKIDLNQSYQAAQKVLEELSGLPIEIKRKIKA